MFLLHKNEKLLLSEHLKFSYFFGPILNLICITKILGFQMVQVDLLVFLNYWTCTFWLKTKDLNDMCIFWPINMVEMTYSIICQLDI